MSVPLEMDHGACADIQHMGGKVGGLVLRQEGGDDHVRAVVHVLHYTVEGIHLPAHPLELAVGAGDLHGHPAADHRDAGLVQSILGALGVGPDQSAGSQQDAAEVVGLKNLVFG